MIRQYDTSKDRELPRFLSVASSGMLSKKDQSAARLVG
uniref:Uncharacterized protein n=1 Tax=Faecalibaculum rodentium TaxID=1702221 RepID=A0A140DZ40_9FIRM|nr:hypothetical protein AALO17_27830 [Faecalibaculum rodentium]